MENIIEVSNLKKSFGEVKAVKGISFSVEQGSLFAFLGVNGAGKSTTIDMISTMLRPDGGSVTLGGHVLGRDDDEIRHEIGIVFQDSLLDPLLTVKENLMLRGSFYGMSKSQVKEKVSKISETVGLGEFLNRRYGKLSGGQRRRADIARALLNTPKVLFLDEPTTGLDPQTRKSVWNTIKSLREDSGMTVFLTTHYMEEAAQADYVTIMSKGEIIARGTPIELKEQYSSDMLKMKYTDKEALAARLQEIGAEYIEGAETLNVKLNDTMQAIPIIEKCKDCFVNFEVVNGTMDDAFLNATGTNLE
ncbi:MAG: ABC transporter ATP-binding protein [Firmicutes bacterium]|nr:ABC transporter ATP-binding protein [Bacillota bacterium]